MKSLLLTVFIFLVSCPSQAGEVYSSTNFSFDVKGYYKNLNFSSKRQATNTGFFADLNRVRVDGTARIFKIFDARVIWDNELISGNFMNTEEFGARQALRNSPYLDLDYEIARSNNFFYGQNFYRATAELDPGFLRLSVGRQKIDWGVMRLLSPVDLFTPISLFDVEKEEKVGETAANLSIPFGSLKINSVYAFNPDFDRSRIGGRITKTIGRFDVSALGGRFLRDGIFGFDFSGDVKGAGVRGELIYDLAGIGKDFVQFAGGMDYGFENTFYFALEYFFSSQATNTAATSLPFPATANQIKSVHKNFLSLLLKYDVTPLWTVSLQNITDMNGASFFINPETKYSFFSWLDFTTGVHLPVGRTGGEFTTIPYVYYFQTQLFF